MQIVIFGNEYHSQDAFHVVKLLRALSEKGGRVVIEESFFRHLSEYCSDLSRYAETLASLEGIDAALSIGGDGTFLRTAQSVARHGIPIMGVNAGHLGYLTTLGITAAEEVARTLMESQYRIEERTMLRLRHGKEEHYALNEVAILRHDSASMIEAEVDMNGLPLTTCKGDGFLVCTATGSTAYNLSVGGPIVHPLTPCFVLSPVSAHSLTMRPMVVSDTTLLRITTHCRTPYYQLSVDGSTLTLPSGSSVDIDKAPFTTKVILSLNHHFASTLRSKLMWGKNNE